MDEYLAFRLQESYRKQTGPGRLCIDLRLAAT